MCAIQTKRLAVLAASALALSGCGDQGSEPPAPAPTLPPVRGQVFKSHEEAWSCYLSAFKAKNVSGVVSCYDYDINSLRVFDGSQTTWQSAWADKYFRAFPQGDVAIHVEALDQGSWDGGTRVGSLVWSAPAGGIRLCAEYMIINEYLERPGTYYIAYHALHKELDSELNGELDAAPSASGSSTDIMPGADSSSREPVVRATSDNFEKVWELRDVERTMSYLGGIVHVRFYDHSLGKVTFANTYDAVHELYTDLYARDLPTAWAGNGYVLGANLASTADRALPVQVFSGISPGDASFGKSYYQLLTRTSKTILTDKPRAALSVLMDTKV